MNSGAIAPNPGVNDPKQTKDIKTNQKQDVMSKDATLKGQKAQA